MLAKAAVLPADALILDLEDSVPPDAKPAARERVAEWLGATATNADRLVRINPLDGEWGHDDLRAILPAGPDGFVVPKVSHASELEALDALMSELEDSLPLRQRTEPTSLVPIATETPSAVFALEGIARAPRVAGLTWGAEDLSAAIGASRSRDDDGRYLPIFELVRHWSLLAAHAAEVAAIDGVYTEFRDESGLRTECEQAAASGFHGKLTIHPSQIEIVNEAFTPSPEAVTAARALLDAYEQHRRAGRGAFAFEGEMIDAPHLARAQRLLDRANR